jgi:hypothetical protein
MLYIIYVAQVPEKNMALSCTENQFEISISVCRFIIISDFFYGTGASRNSEELLTLNS